MSRRKLISIVTPCYNEEANIASCVTAIRSLFSGPLARHDYEHIFCDNASTDQTLARLREVAAGDPKVKVIVNARNFGPVRSCYNGILAAAGDAAVLFFPADLQDPPEVIPRFVELWEQGFQVVRGLRTNRQEGIFLRTLRKIYYRALARLADIHLPVDSGEFQLVDRCILVALRQFDDYYPYIRGMVASCGFTVASVPYRWERRRRGKSKSNWYVLIDIGLNGLISFSNIPLRLCLLAGFLIAAGSITYGAVDLVLMLAAMLIYDRQIAAPGIPTLIVALFFFSGVQLFFLGLLGEYLNAVHSQVRRRPLVLERERINFPEQPTTAPTNLQLADPSPDRNKPIA